MTRLRSWLRWLTAAGLGIDVYVHWHLAPRFDTLKSSVNPHVSQGQLFRIEAVLAPARDGAGTPRSFAVGRRVRLAGRRRRGVVAVLLYRYVDVGSIGPPPDMYDPSWYAEKTLSA